MICIGNHMDSSAIIPKFHVIAYWSYTSLLEQCTVQNKQVSDARLNQVTLLTGKLNAITFASHEAHAINAM